MTKLNKPKNLRSIFQGVIDSDKDKMQVAIKSGFQSEIIVLKEPIIINEEFENELLPDKFLNRFIKAKENGIKIETAAKLEKIQDRIKDDLSDSTYNLLLDFILQGGKQIWLEQGLVFC